MTWIAEQPTVAGRYLWRDPVSGSYGVMLMAWTRAFVVGQDVYESQLQVRGVVKFGQVATPESPWVSSSSETEYGGGWSFGGNFEWESCEHWSEPFDAGLFPVITNEPHTIPETEVSARLQEAAERQDKADKAAVELDALREDDIANAIDLGQTIYECESCGHIHSESELVEVRHYECSHCSCEFYSADDNHCPDCNRTFCRVEGRLPACPECTDDEPALRMLVNAGVRCEEEA